MSDSRRLRQAPELPSGIPQLRSKDRSTLAVEWNSFYRLMSEYSIREGKATGASGREYGRPKA